MNIILSMLDGNKTKIGAVLLLISAQLSALGVDTTQYGPLLHQIMAGIGAVIALIGLIHKFIKSLRGSKITAKQVEAAAAKMLAKLIESQMSPPPATPLPAPTPTIAPVADNASKPESK